MNIITWDRVLRLTDSTIDAAENELGSHNEQVTYITYKLMKAMEDKEPEFIHRMCITAYLHDIGCYKTDDRANITKLEAMKPHKHAAYGFVFLKLFYSENIDLSAIKYHHLPWNLKPTTDEEISEYAFLLHLADRISIALTEGIDVVDYVNKNCGTLFAPEHVELFNKANEDNLLLTQIKNDYYCIEIRSFLSHFILSHEEIISVAKMMCYAMDFSSVVTVKHNLLVTAITKKLAQLYSLPDETVEEMTLAAQFHDIGKLVVPTHILEKPGKLTKEEYNVMKYHAVTGYDILSAMGLENLRDIASLHHEKLDGSGYPFGLLGDQLPFSMRLVAVADILAALLQKRSYKDKMDKDATCSILKKMADHNKIDSDIVSKVIENFDEIITRAKIEAEPVLAVYKKLNEEYEKELNKILSLLK